jgi:hypothetical protein
MAMASARAILSVEQARREVGLVAGSGNVAAAMRAQAQLVQAQRQAELVARFQNTDAMRVAQMGVQITECSGTIFVEGAGEVTPPPIVQFPVAFIEKPAISGGYELVDNQALEAGNFPTCNVGVVRWVTYVPDRVRTYYVGAHLGIVTTGREDQLFYAHWQMRGRALRNPIADTGEAH